MTTSQKVRVRFAPSPTGALHLGTARSALYNWLYARHFGEAGTYVLRIEDTDTSRSDEAHVQQALAVFRWLGLEWDEGPEAAGEFGPYFQSQRSEMYKTAVAELRQEGAAYPCFCTADELAAERKSAEAEKRPYIYSGCCRAVTPQDAEQRISDGAAHVIRFSVPANESIVVTDLILGEVSFDTSLIGDFVIARADGSPLYNLANVVDDAHMKITHVIRGNDHLSNTPKQVLLYGALGHDVPQFAHVPMVHGPDGAKLSKRRHHTSTVEQLAEGGYAPAAVRNALALMGWAKDDVTTVMTTDDIVEHFDIARVKKSPATLDYERLRWINGEHFKLMTDAEWSRGFESWRSQWVTDEHDDYEVLHAFDANQVTHLVREKVTTWGEVGELLAFAKAPFTVSDAAWKKLAKSGEVGIQVIDAAMERFDGMSDFSEVEIEAELRALAEQMELKPGKVFGPVRFAALGQAIAPGLWESLAVLGKTETLHRLSASRDRLESSLTNA